MFTVTVETFAEAVVLRCRGRIVRGDETSLLCPAMRQQSQNIVLDLTEVDAIDAAGIGALVSLQAAGIYLTLLNPTQQVREVLRITKLDSLFEICESRSIVPTAESIRAVLPGNQSAPLNVPVV